MKTTRRTFIKHAAAATAVASALPGCGDAGLTPLVCDDPAVVLPTDLPTYVHEGALGPETMFQHGVASGDPLTTSVILWTRVTPEVNGDVPVFYEVALDTAFTRRIAAGTFTTSEARDFTVKVDVSGLAPGLTHYYRFMALGRTSLVGRTRTAPEGVAHHARFAVASCSNFAAGYFHVYRRIAERADLDAVLHLGDYIYETGGANMRAHEPAYEIITLADYRMRYSQYHRDPDLIAARRQHPFIAVWDDHETTNNAWSGGAGNHNEGEGTYEDRRAAAAQAYSEWMPIRDQVDGQIYRTLRYGDLLDLMMLDTRIVGRDQQLGDIENETDTRSILGATQEAWLAGELASSTARWRLLGQQVMMGQLALAEGAVLLNLDQWDGYPSARGRLLDVIENNALENVVVLTGDIHSSWANEIVRDPWRAYDPATSEGALAVEFVTPAVTSSGLGAEGDVIYAQVAMDNNPHIKFVNAWSRGYIVLDVQLSRLQCDFFHLDGVGAAEGNGFFRTGFTVKSGRSRLEEVTEPATPREGCAFAPDA